MTPSRTVFARFRRLFLLSVVAATTMTTLSASLAHAQGAQDVWTTDGPINAVARSGNTLYVGGYFSRIGPSTGGALYYDPASAQPLVPWPAVAGTVLAAAPDGAGGWYIGGSFTSVQREPRNNLAHLDVNGNVTPWNPNANAEVKALLRVGRTVYVGGSFSQVSNVARSSLAAVDTSGALASWNPVALGGAVYSLAARTTPSLTIYAGGAFGIVGIAARSRVAALDSTGAVLAWNPNSNGIVHAMAVSGGTVYLGGTFSALNGGTARSYIAAVDAGTGTLTGWNPGSDGAIYALATTGGNVYAGGSFTAAGGQPRNNLAAIDSATGLATGWNPAPNQQGYVTALALRNNTIFAGGRFTQIGGQPRLHLARLDLTSGLATAWAPQPNDEVDVIGVGATILAGGYFTSSGGVARNSLAAIDLTTGHATAWNPGADNPVLCLLPSGGQVYVGGTFLHVGGQPHAFIAAVDTVTGAVRTWNPSIVGGQVSAIAREGSTVYFGGGFTFVGGQHHDNLAAVDTGTAVSTAWHPAANGSVQAMLIDGGVVYLGGSFTTLGPGPTAVFADSLRGGLGAVDLASGAVLPWNPKPSSPFAYSVSALALSGGELYAGGGFTSMGGQPHQYLAAVDPVTGLPSPWKPDPDGVVNALAADGGVLYAGGAFKTIGTDAATRNRIAALDPVSGATTAWDANANNTVNALTAQDGVVCAGGAFTAVTNRPFGHLAVITEATTGVAPAPLPLAERLAIAPNPSRGAVLLRFAIAAPGDGEVALYDLRGRRVRVLAHGAFAAGDTRLSWDGRDASGRRVAPGIYFASVRVGAQRIVGRVLRLE